MKIQILDHGYCEFIESWGSDERIIEAARMSTDKGFNGWGTEENPGDEKLLAYLWNNHHCYDEQSEVLTSNGFVPWNLITKEDKLGGWDDNINSLVYETPYSLIKQEYDGEMYRVNHGGVDLLVTPNHKMLVKTMDYFSETKTQHWSNNWSLIESSKLGNRSMIRFRKHSEFKISPEINLNLWFPKHDDRSSLLKLIGFFIGDGHAEKPNINGKSSNKIIFHLKKKRKISWLTDICNKLNWELGILANDSYTVTAKGITDIFRNLFYDKNSEKQIPEFLLKTNSVDANFILDGFKNSDGSVKRSTWEYCTTSKQVADGFQLLVLHSGGSCHIRCDDNYLYRIGVLSRMLEPVINQGTQNTSLEQYRGYVYCAYTRTGILVIRRNGKIVLSGNSTPFEMAGMILEIKAPIMVFREWHRHRTQGYNEMSARYVPLPDENYVPTIERLLTGANTATTNKQAQSSNQLELTEQSAMEWLGVLDESYKQAQYCYEYGLSLGIPKELARLPVPVGRYSRMRVTCNLRNWLAFLTLRQDSKAQYEIRVYADQVCKLIEEHFPRTAQLFIQSQVK
jgi:thymidylate synthase (FAD)